MADTAPISRFPVPDLDGVPADLREVMTTYESKLGFIPNVFWALAWRPDHFRAFMQYHDVLMKGESGLTKAEREMIVVAVSDVNACLYCTVAHGAAVRVLAKHPHLSDQITANYRHAELTDRQRAMLEFSVKVTKEPGAVEEADLDRLRRHGFTDADIWDIGSVAAFFNLSNRLANLAAMRPNREFYGLGR